MIQTECLRRHQRLSFAVCLPVRHITNNLTTCTVKHIRPVNKFIGAQLFYTDQSSQELYVTLHFVAY